MSKKILFWISITSILLSLFLIGIAIDSAFLDGKYLGNFSLNLFAFFENIFGNFCFLIFSIGLITGIALLFFNNPLYKTAPTLGYILFSLFIPAFVETFKLGNLNTGDYGLFIANLFTTYGFSGTLVIYFFWFLSSIFLMLFPFKELIFSSISKLIDNSKSDSDNKATDRKTNKKILKPIDTNKIIDSPMQKTVNHKKRQNKFKQPWLSKVIYENDENRIEIPIIPHTGKISKFKLKSSIDDSVHLYDEVDTFSKITQTNQINSKEQVDGELELAVPEEEYFEMIKNNWPQEWVDKKNNGSFLEEYENTNNNINIEEFIETENNDFDVEKIYSENFSNKNQKKNISYSNTKYSKDILPIMQFTDKKNKITPINFETEQKEAAKILEDTLGEFGIEATVTNIIHGPVVTLFKLLPGPRIRLQKIASLSDNLAMRLAAKSIRIIAPIPGEKVVGIEIPNKRRELVSFNEIVSSEQFSESNYNIPIGLGKDIYGNIIVADLHTMPHILIAGATGAGKSVCVNAFISSILFSKTPEEVRLLLIDPKIVELKPYNNIPHLLYPVITESKKALLALKYLSYEMERRYTLLDQVGARDIVEYNNIITTHNYQVDKLPFIVTFVDEFADLLSTSGKETEFVLTRLAAKARAIGIHLVLATQRPSANVITGLIKSNIPARIAFQVISNQDSRIILDQSGAEKLLGKGDMLYLSVTQPFPIRLQGAFLSLDDVNRIAEHWKSIAEPDYIDIEEMVEEVEEEERENAIGQKDPLFEDALDIIRTTQKASASFLQRRLGIGYNRAAKIIEQLEAMGIVGPQNGSKPREVLKI